MAENKYKKNKETSKTAESLADNLRLTDLLSVCLSRWYLFAFAITICLSLAVVKILKTPKVYATYASILIKESYTTNSSSNIDDILTGDGVTTMSSKLANEMATFRSPALMREVSDRLKLYIEYSTIGKFHNDVIFGEDVPVLVDFLDDQPTWVSCMLYPEENGFTVTEEMMSGEEMPEKLHGEYGDTLSTQIGRIIVEQSPMFTKEWTTPIKVSYYDKQAVASMCSGKLTVTPEDMNNRSDVLNLTYKDVAPARAESILNMLIAVYSEWWVTDKNRMAVSSSAFIDDRLMAIESELGSVDESISNYKSENLLPNLGEASKMYLMESSEINREIQEINNQITVARQVYQYLQNSRNFSELIPASASITDASLSSQINKYNESVLQRNAVLENSSMKNPLVIDMGNALSVMREGILSSIDKMILALKARKSSLLNFEKKANDNIAKNPHQEKYLLNVERQQKVKETLYLFLLQKREENELSQAFTAYNTKIITPPITNKVPTEPKKKEILLIAMLAGIAIPIILIYLRGVFSTKLRGKADLDKLTVPFLGEVPQYYTKEERRRKFKKFLNKLRKKKQKKDVEIIVQAGSRNMINEAFRVVRTNLEFMHDPQDGCEIIAITSFNLGSGKTFVSANLSTTLSLNHRRVLIVDTDFRKTSLSKCVGKPKKGFADYLAGKIDNIYDVIIHEPDGHTDLDILPVGNRPPNPSELLSSVKFKYIINSLASQYDYIILDCPPVNVVADTMIINAVVSRTIFIARCGLLDRSMIPEIQLMYDENALKKLCLVLNGTEPGVTKYGYRYGYLYGYGYGYSYEDKER